MPSAILLLSLIATTCSHVPAPSDASCVLTRAIDATGMRTQDGRVLRLRSRMVRELRDLSDRPAPPFDASIVDEETWLDPRSGIERTSIGPSVLWNSPHGTLMGVDFLRAAPVALHGFARWQRAFDAWAVLADWSEHGDAILDGQPMYRGYRVTALRRPDGSRLLFNETDGLPVALLRIERSYFLGPESVEYRYFNWEHVGGATLPLSVMRLVDGKRDRLRTAKVGATETALVVRDSAPAFPALSRFIAMRDTVVAAPEPFWPSATSDTVRVGAHSFLLVGAAFTSAVALAGDTVFILDAPQGEERARQDSVWIGKLFPGKHALAFLVSTDIWPHIAGLRYWAAVGATILVHPVTRPVVDMALARRWTTGPDLFEQRRDKLRPKVEAIRSRQARGGDVRIFAVDGASSEGVLAAYVQSDGFLWASDRVQDVESPSLYVTELWRAAQRSGVAPRVTSGPHLRAVSWSTLEPLVIK